MSNLCLQIMGQARRSLNTHSGMAAIRVWVMVCLAFISLGFGLTACTKKSPESLKIGFLGDFSVFAGDWTTACRDGAQLRIEEINAAGGIRGQRLELVVKDAEQFKSHPTQVIDELMKARVTAIIGPVTSSSAVKIVPYGNEKGQLMISPSASTETLSDQDDLFFRTTATNAFMARTTADYLYAKAGWRTVAATYATANRTFNEGWYMAFKQRFEQLGGIVRLGNILTEQADRAVIARSLASAKADGILIVSHAIEVAELSQELRRTGVSLPLATTGVAHTPDLIQHGGEAVEGIIFAVTFVEDETWTGFQKFKERYRKRFNKNPVLPDVYGYEAATVLTDAMSHSQDLSAAALKQTILRIGRFDSPISPQGLKINRYGDVERNLIFITVRNGRFTRLE